MLETQEFRTKMVKVFNYTDEIKEVIEIDFMGYDNKGGRKGKKSNEVSKEDRVRNLKRVKRNVRRLAFANDLGQVHLTITFKENMQDADKADQHFKEYMKQLHSTYKNLKYLATREFQKRGAIHYHVLLNQRIDIRKSQKLWKHGFISLAAHKNKMKAVMYVLKYVSKEVGQTVLTTKKGHTKKAYLSSQGLKKELLSCTTGFLINTPQEYDDYLKEVEFLLEKFKVGWDIQFEIVISEKDDKKIQGRSMLRCAANNY